MTNQPAPIENNPDLFDLAATLAGCAPVDLLKVRQEGAALVVILATGQKFVFDAPEIAGQIAAALNVQLPAPAPAPLASEAPPKRRKAA